MRTPKIITFGSQTIGIRSTWRIILIIPIV
nr:MAG TPA: hypothetical protein [Caudoviricetes sp.]